MKRKELLFFRRGLVPKLVILNNYFSDLYGTLIRIFHFWFNHTFHIFILNCCIWTLSWLLSRRKHVLSCKQWKASLFFFLKLASDKHIMQNSSASCVHILTCRWTSTLCGFNRNKMPNAANTSKRECSGGLLWSMINVGYL